MLLQVKGLFVLVTKPACWSQVDKFLVVILRKCASSFASYSTDETKPDELTGEEVVVLVMNELNRVGSGQK